MFFILFENVGLDDQSTLNAPGCWNTCAPLYQLDCMRAKQPWRNTCVPLPLTDCVLINIGSQCVICEPAVATIVWELVSNTKAQDPPQT